MLLTIVYNNIIWHQSNRKQTWKEKLTTLEFQIPPPKKKHRMYVRVRQVYREISQVVIVICQ